MNVVNDDKSEIRWIPDGFHFRGPKKAENRRKIINEISEFFKKSSYTEVFLPSFDYSATFSNHLQTEGSVLKVRDFAGSEISPSSDLTIQAVKGIAGNSDIENLKIFYTSSVVRDNQLHNGRRRESFQAGAEIIGRSDNNTIAEIIQEIQQIMNFYGLADKFILVLGNSQIIRTLAAEMKLSAKDSFEFSRLLYKKDWPGMSHFLQQRKIPDTLYEIVKLLLFADDFTLVAQGLQTSGIPGFDAILSATREFLNIKNINICADYSLIRDLDYYTGYIFQGYIAGFSQPLVTGGVYDHLYRRFSDEEKPACGYAVDLDLLEELIELK